MTTPFEKVIPLDVTNLPAGAYTVVVNGVRGSFKLDADNVLPVEPTVTPAPAALGSINGWMWHDGCGISGQPIGPGKDTTGCVQEGDHYRANGIKESSEAIIPGVKVKLGAGPCLAIGLAEAAGARILKPAAKTFWGGYDGYFADPDGNLWEVAFNPHWGLGEDGLIKLPE